MKAQGRDSYWEVNSGLALPRPRKPQPGDAHPAGAKGTMKAAAGGVPLATPGPRKFQGYSLAVLLKVSL